MCIFHGTLHDGSFDYIIVIFGIWLLPLKFNVRVRHSNYTFPWKKIHTNCKVIIHNVVVPLMYDKYNEISNSH